MKNSVFEYFLPMYECRVYDTVDIPSIPRKELGTHTRQLLSIYMNQQNFTRNSF